MTTGTSLFDDKLNINVGATFDPYAINENGSRVNKFNRNGALFRMTSANVNMGFSFSSKNSKEDKSSKSGFNNTRSGGRDDDLFGRVDDFADSSFDNEEEEDDQTTKKEDSKFYNNKMPWDIRLAHSLTYSNNKAQKEITNNSLMFSGNISLSKKWKIGGSKPYLHFFIKKVL